MADDSTQPSVQNPWAQSYRDRWKWDKVTWGCHCVDCYPSNCPYRVYVKDGRVVREEQAGQLRDDRSPVCPT